MKSITILVLCLLGWPAVAKERAPAPTPQYTCDDVRAAVALAGGVEQAIRIIKSRKNPPDDRLIEEARSKCLK